MLVNSWLFFPSLSPSIVVCLSRLGFQRSRASVWDMCPKYHMQCDRLVSKKHSKIIIKHCGYV
jgi:hypothetical protein